MSKQNIRVRFAPSPTGYLHIGGLRTALFNFLFARHHGGQFVVRIEDTDKARYTKAHEEAITQGLAWSGIASDEPIIKQSDNVKRHDALINELLAHGLAYRCFCSYEELQEKRHQATQAGLTYQYDGTCRNKIFPEHAKFEQKHVIRFKVQRDTDKPFVFHDIIRKNVELGFDHIDDFIIKRSTGGVTYNFAVVVDDHDMHISHVIRGEEHLLNTPKQILLYQAFGWEIPYFAHLPLILSPHGGKLSKRDGAVSVTEYAKQGVVAPALNNYLVRLGWSHKDQEIFSMQEMIALFDLAGVGKTGAVFDQQKLYWVNSMHIKTMPAHDIIASIQADMQRDLMSLFSAWDTTKRERAVDIFKERAQTLQELLDHMHLVYQAPMHYDQASVDKWVDLQTSDVLHLVQQNIDAVDFTDAAAIKQAIKAVVTKTEKKFPQVAQPIRIALLGESSGPGIVEIMQLLGKQEVMQRLQNCWEFLREQ